MTEMPDEKAASPYGTWKGIPAVVSRRIWNYIDILGVDRETTRDLYQEAEDAIWEAAAHRAYDENHSYLVKTGIGAIRHWLRDRYSFIRVPGYLHDRGQAAEHSRTVLSLDGFEEVDTESSLIGESFENEFLEQADLDAKRQELFEHLNCLTRAECEVLCSLLEGYSVREIAVHRQVRVSGIYTLRARAINKLKNLITSGNGKSNGDNLKASDSNEPSL